MKILKKTLAVILCLCLLSGLSVCFAADTEKKYLDYKSYVLLGDSVASGWSDVEEIESRFVRVEGSYGAYLADDLGVEEYHPMACIGFRTVEMRYIFEEDFEPDRFLYYSIDKEEMDNKYAPAMRKAVSEADLITLNIGGNDWGSFLGWHVYEEMDKQEANSQFIAELKKYLEEGNAADPDGQATIDAIIDIAAVCGALPDLFRILPFALKEGLENFFTNWNYMIEDIYALNPDVTLVVVGMFDNSIQAEEDWAERQNSEEKLYVSQMIIDFANIPMVEGAKKYGYIYVDTAGTVCEEHHPSRGENGGHRYIADKILEALPDANYPYTDVKMNGKDFKAYEYMYKNNIMSGLTSTTFGPDELLTKAQLAEALYNIAGAPDVSGIDRSFADVDDSHPMKAAMVWADSNGILAADGDNFGPDETLQKATFISAIFKAIKTEGTDFIGTIKALIYTFSYFIKEIFTISKDITRGEAVMKLMEYIEKF